MGVYEQAADGKLYFRLNDVIEISITQFITAFDLLIENTEDDGFKQVIDNWRLDLAKIRNLLVAVNSIQFKDHLIKDLIISDAKKNPPITDSLAIDEVKDCISLFKSIVYAMSSVSKMYKNGEVFRNIIYQMNAVISSISKCYII